MGRCKSRGSDDELSECHAEPPGARVVGWGSVVTLSGAETLVELDALLYWVEQCGRAMREDLRSCRLICDVAVAVVRMMAAAVVE